MCVCVCVCVCELLRQHRLPLVSSPVVAVLRHLLPKMFHQFSFVMFRHHISRTSCCSVDGCGNIDCSWSSSPVAAVLRHQIPKMLLYQFLHLPSSFGFNSFFIGFNTSFFGFYSFSIGFNTSSFGFYSFSIGFSSFVFFGNRLLLSVFQHPFPAVSFLSGRWFSALALL